MLSSSSSKGSSPSASSSELRLMNSKPSTQPPTPIQKSPHGSNDDLFEQQQQQHHGQSSTSSSASPSHSSSSSNSSSSAVETQNEKEHRESKNFRANAELFAIILLNLVSVVGIVAVNKKIFQYPDFKFPSTLMSLHFTVTYLFVLLFHKLGYFEAKQIESKQYVKLGAAQVGSVAFVNLSLVYNDVGTYQLMKFLVIFVTCILEYLMYKKVYSGQVYAVLAAVVLSISLATISSLNPSAIGVGFGLLGALGTSYYQIYNKFVQTEFGVKPLQLLHYEQPWSAGWCLLFALVTEPVYMIPQIAWSQELVGLIALSAVCAFCVNASVYMIIGKTSPITYSVLGHVKTISVFAVGIFFLGDAFSPSQAFWMCVAFSMIVVYGQLSASPTAAATQQPKKEEVVLLNSGNGVQR